MSSPDDRRRARRITGSVTIVDDTPATGLPGYVWIMSGWHQFTLAALAVGGALLNLAPIELQRRMVDDAIVAGDAALLFWLGGVYAAALLAHKGAKFLLAWYQGWVAEKTIAYTRAHLSRLYGQDGVVLTPGKAVSIIGGEVDKLGAFVGGGPSTALANAATLVGVFGYMLVVEPAIAALSFALLAPQLLLTPLMQRRLNALLQRRVEMMRLFGDRLAETGQGDVSLILRLLHNRMVFIRLKAVLKTLLNLMSDGAALAILMLGGWLVVEGQTTVGVVLAFVSGFGRIAGPLRDLMTFYRQASQAGVQHQMIARWMRRDVGLDDAP